MATSTPTSSMIENTIKEYFASKLEFFDTKSSAQSSRTQTEDCNFSLAPASFHRELGIPAGFALSNTAWDEHVLGQLPLLHTAQSERLETVIDAAARKAVVHVRNEMVLKDGNKATVENALFFYFIDDGTKIKKIVEFTDVVETKRYLGLVEEAKHAAKKE
ncbi:hypothetical protein B0H63DRAFT_257196 [Podospora didyma]|uniref:SnoaL-like domain-containing protein n=1 Tax=Podospora didyma TaxID=330526 RepID=A0AAE0N8K7_9PEZI|nr:hypothetical protein B0H63DRAFT_257196 [Podospora didyma]